MMSRIGLKSAVSFVVDSINHNRLVRPTDDRTLICLTLSGIELLVLLSCL